MDLNKKLKELKPQQLNCNVFDVYSYNGLTMQDLLCQFFTTINECVKSTNEVIDLTDWLVSVGLEEEVVKKLMALIEDGTVEKLINVNLFKTLNNEINGLSSQLEHIENETATKQELEVERNRINSFTKLQEGSTTGDAELIDARIGADSVVYNNLGDAIRNQFKKVNDKFKSNNLLDQSVLKLNYVCNQNGAFVSTQNYNCFSDIPVKKGVKYNISPTARFIVLVDHEKSFIYSSGSATSDADLTFTPFLDGYVHITYASNDTYKAKLYVNGTDENIVAPYSQCYLSDNVKLKDNGVYEIVENVLNNEVKLTDNLLTKGELHKNMYYDTYQKPTSNNTYSYFKVPITEGVEYNTNNRARFIVLVNSNNIKQSNSYTGEVFEPTTFTALVNGYAYITVYNTDLETFALYESGKSENLIKFGKYKLNENILVTKENIDSSINTTPSNVLTTKKWISCGDSFTAGGYATSDGIDETTYKYQEGIYKGKQITYPYIIGLRNNMTIINEAVSGSTMANNSKASAGSFSISRYKNIVTNHPDVDYITLYFGINDDNYSSELGTINDEVNTTFYGAWNIVLEYLITNLPYTKIGIIVTNGSNPKYTNATREIAKKWGIPMLDLELDYNVPLMHRATERPELCAKVIELRENAFRISKTNRHPNVKAHEYESTFIENFLRSL